MKSFIYKTRLLLMGALAVFAFANAKADTNLVTNGSFEDGALGLGSFSGWQTKLPDALTFVDSSGQNGRLAGQASDGLWSAYFGSPAILGGAIIAQTLSTIAGQSYVLRFDLANDNGGALANDALTVNIDDASVLSFSNIDAQGYATQTVLFSAFSTSTVLSFNAYNENGYLQIDRVSVTAVPEPDGVWLAMAGCAALVGLSAFKRQRLI